MFQNQCTRLHFSQSCIKSGPCVKSMKTQRNRDCNRVKLFLDADTGKNIICSWGFGSKFEANTTFINNHLNATRLRNVTLPTVHQLPLYRVNRMGPRGFIPVPLLKFKLMKNPDEPKDVKNSCQKTVNETSQRVH